MSNKNLTFARTEDGSLTIFNASVGEHYHSRHGALQESRHVFIGSGLDYFLKENMVSKARILEVGFGTGLNFLLTADYAQEHQVEIHYSGIEAYPLPAEMIPQTKYDQYIASHTWKSFIQNYTNSFIGPVEINRNCTLELIESTLIEFTSENKYDVLYFDAFAAIHQPEMWTDDSLRHICSFLKPGGVFVTYAITGNLKRSMKALGFQIEKAPGAPGKREMLRAVKNAG